MKNVLLFVGFLLIMYGFLSLFLGMSGLQLTFLNWLDNWGNLNGFLIRLGMIMTGFIIAFYAKVDWKKERELLEE